MTGNILLDLLISLAGIIFLAGMASWLFPLGATGLSEDVVSQYLKLEEPDFHLADLFLSSDRKVLLAISQNRQEIIVLISRRGDKVHRRSHVDAVDMKVLSDKELKIGFKDITFADVIVRSDASKDWGKWLGEMIS